VKLLIDEQLPPQLKPWFAAREWEAVHVFDVGLKAAGDARIADYAVRERQAIVTKDEDFLDIASRAEVQLLWLRCGNLITRKLIALLDRNWAMVEPQLRAGRPLVIVE
jgi:predicted nuclease of predicted toxin-antitoxin system